VPVVNKIDLARAYPDEVVQEIEELIGVRASEVIRTSATEGIGIELTIILSNPSLANGE
jgi:GTP-binding protein LepA